MTNFTTARAIAQILLGESLALLGGIAVASLALRRPVWGVVPPAILAFLLAVMSGVFLLVTRPHRTPPRRAVGPPLGERVAATTDTGRVRQYLVASRVQDQL